MEIGAAERKVTYVYLTHLLVLCTFRLARSMQEILMFGGCSRFGNGKGQVLAPGYLCTSHTHRRGSTASSSALLKSRVSVSDPTSPI
jgi:hypothetical protein